MAARDALSPVRPIYHFLMAFLSAIVYRFPSKRIKVIGVTGTKGKSSVLEYLNGIFEEAGMTTALLGTIREKIGDATHPNKRRMTMPGRFAIQRFLSRAVEKGCDIAFLEMTSEGARQYRHRFIDLDALIFINLAPEHIESHGSLEAYANAKFELGKQLVRSSKRPRFIVANADDAESGRYLGLKVEHALPFSLAAIESWSAGEHGGTLRFHTTDIEVKLPGEFSLKNALAAATLAHAMGITPNVIARGIARVETIPGRAEEISEGQTFSVIVDYAHTPDSLRAIYRAFPSRRKICILGSTGGGRDMWKRPVMGKVAEEECDHVILTNEDPYDEDPRSIVDMIRSGMTKEPEIVMDRREAMRRAFVLARASDVVIITGKGTDPTIQGPKGSKVPWSDAGVAREEIRKLLAETPTTSPSRMTDAKESISLGVARPFLGTSLDIILDRPKGSTHPTEGFPYEVNYGYVPDTSVPDGRQLDAYFLSDAQPGKVRGRCIAIIHRFHDDDDKIVVVAEDAPDLSDEEIEKLVAFREQYYPHEILRA